MGRDSAEPQNAQDAKLKAPVIFMLASRIMALHKSDSSEQQEAESYVLKAIEDKFDLCFNTNASLGIGVEPDGIDPEKRVVVEAYSHIGKLKGAQLHKVRADILKLAFIEKKLGISWRKIMCFIDPEAASFLLGKSWAAEAARSFNIEILVVKLTAEKEALIKSAQKRQRMVNAP